MEVFYMTQRTHTGALWQSRRVEGGGRWKGCSGGRGHGSTCGWFLMYDRKLQNSVKQISFNFKNKVAKNVNMSLHKWVASPGNVKHIG